MSRVSAQVLKATCQPGQERIKPPSIGGHVSEETGRGAGRRVTSADVAAAAGVSRATVSYVLNGVPDRISAGTRARVLDAAERLGYTPNAVASALRAGRTEVVLLALPPWPLGPAVADWLSAGVAEFERLGYTPLVHFRHGTDAGGFARACDRVRPVGLVGPGEDLPPRRVAALRENGTRAVLAIAPAPLEHVTTLVVDQALVGELAVRHLAERGHRRIVAALPSSPEPAAIAAERMAGARHAAGEHGATLVEVASQPEGAAAAVAPEVEAGATAVAAFNDEYALAALAALGRKVAIIGCDDSAAARRADLTTIALGNPSDWAEYVERIHGLIGGEPLGAPLIARPTLIPRATT
jgi:DNA-binding LacI/PurR family transcriptional regulator